MLETMEKMSQAEYEAFSLSTYEKFASGTTDLDKSGAADMDVMTRKMVREGSFFDSIITPKELSPDENVIQVDTDQHVVLIPFEPDSPGAVATYLDGPSDQFYAYGRYYPLRLQEFNTGTVVKTLLELETYKYDIRQILGDNMVKDLIAMNDYLGMDPNQSNLGCCQLDELLRQSSDVSRSEQRDHLQLLERCPEASVRRTVQLGAHSLLVGSSDSA